MLRVLPLTLYNNVSVWMPKHLSRNTSCSESVKKQVFVNNVLKNNIKYSQFNYSVSNGKNLADSSLPQ